MTQDILISIMQRVEELATSHMALIMILKAGGYIKTGTDDAKEEVLN
jgi:hypothetical protein